MDSQQHVIMVAGENDALKNGKVGGVGDVIRDLPRALADLGRPVTVITPSYGFLHVDNPSKQIDTVHFPFGGKTLEGKMYEVTAKLPHSGVLNYVFEHSGIRGTPIYFNDPPDEPFAQDGTKYALFCSAIGEYLKKIPLQFILHLHDWHTGMLLFLREMHPDFSHLKKIKTVFTIHNLAIQGNRPLLGKYATTEQWFPELFHDVHWIEQWKDPRFPVPNLTPMAIGIEHADAVNTVSPTYAEEILLPSDPTSGKFRGEGLEKILQRAKQEDRLFGILNGCDYPESRIPPKVSFPVLCDLIIAEVTKWNSKNADPVNDEIIGRVQTIRNLNLPFLVTSVTRVVEQKIKLLFEETSRQTVVIDDLCEMLSAINGVYMILGTGTKDYEDRLMERFRKHERCIYLKGFSETIGNALYANGTIFMMPSSFEPCGIGQMIAMRDGQPCIVHAVGGLKDTVIDGVNGFQFFGNSLREQADQCLAVTQKAIDIKLNDANRWQNVVAEAFRARFTWGKSAKEYIDLLYR